MLLGMGRRRGVSADETRAELLDAAMKVVLDKGYAGTRVSEIAREANVTSGAIYNHFESKTELLLAAIADQSPHAISELLRSGASPDVLDAFAQVGRRLPEGRVLGPTLLELIATSTRDPEVAAVLGEVFTTEERVTTDLVRDAQTAGEVDAGLDADALVRFTTMVALGAMAVNSLGLRPVDDTAWAAVIDRMLGAVRADAATTGPIDLTHSDPTHATITPQGDHQ